MSFLRGAEIARLRAEKFQRTGTLGYSAAAAAGSSSSASAAADKPKEEEEDTEYMPGLKEIFKEESECHICQQYLVEPVTLNCKHAYCLNCIEEWFETAAARTCPLCREKHKGRLKPKNVFEVVAHRCTLLEKDGKESKYMQRVEEQRDLRAVRKKRNEEEHTEKEKQREAAEKEIVVISDEEEEDDDDEEHEDGSESQSNSDEEDDEMIYESDIGEEDAVKRRKSKRKHEGRGDKRARKLRNVNGKKYHEIKNKLRSSQSTATAASASRSRSKRSLNF